MDAVFFRYHASEGSRKQQVKKHKKENCRIRAVLFGRSLIESAAAFSQVIYWSVVAFST